jgi:hypothetical protein
MTAGRSLLDGTAQRVFVGRLVRNVVLRRFAVGFGVDFGRSLVILTVALREELKLASVQFEVQSGNSVVALPEFR